jgi:hypothetical protein
MSMAILCSSRSAFADGGKFYGNLRFVDDACVKQKWCKLREKFAFVDYLGVGWEAAAGLETDGATIPGWAQPFIGPQFAPEFIRAAVIHDHYCRRHVRVWPMTHRVFYDALIASGLERNKAKLMYFAVYGWGPKWATLIPGRPCKTDIRLCINKQPKLTQYSGRKGGYEELAIAHEKDQIFVVRDSFYGDPEIGPRMIEAEAFLAKNPDATLKDMEALAEKMFPKDDFMRYNFLYFFSDDREAQDKSTLIRRGRLGE